MTSQEYAVTLEFYAVEINNIGQLFVTSAELWAERPNQPHFFILHDSPGC